MAYARKYSLPNGKTICQIGICFIKKGDVIFDPLMGSGTASVVAKKLSRHSTGIEINEERGLWVAQRILMVNEDSPIQGYFDGVFGNETHLHSKRK